MISLPVSKTRLDNGEIIASRSSGAAGKTVLLIHGNMSSSVHWMPLMEQLHNNYRVDAVDLRGFGDSSYDSEINALKDFADDINAWMDLNHKTYDMVIGWSTGGGVALELAALNPTRIHTVVLLDSVGVQGFEMYKKHADGSPDFTSRLVTKEDIALDPVQVVPVIEAYKNNNKELLKYIWDVSIYHEKQPESEAYAVYLDAMMQQRNLVDVDYALVHFNITNTSNGVADGSGLYQVIKQPLIVVHGVLDRVVPFEEASKIVELFGEQATLVAIENAGHSVITDDIEALVNVVNEFI